MSMKVYNDGIWEDWASSGGSFEKAEASLDNPINNTSSFINGLGDELWEFSRPIFEGTNFNYAFYGMKTITTIPELGDTSNISLFNYMFEGCESLINIPYFSTENAIGMTNMFKNCASLVSVPYFNTYKVGGFQSMFQGCQSLLKIPPFDMTKSTNTNFFAAQLSTRPGVLERCEAFGFTRTISFNYNNLSAAAINEIFTLAGTAALGASISVIGNPGSASCDTTIATAKGWTVNR